MCSITLSLGSVWSRSCAFFNVRNDGEHDDDRFDLNRPAANNTLFVSLVEPTHTHWIRLKNIGKNIQIKFSSLLLLFYLSQFSVVCLNFLKFSSAAWIEINSEANWINMEFQNGETNKKLRELSQMALNNADIHINRSELTQFSIYRHPGCEQWTWDAFFVGCSLAVRKSVDKNQSMVIWTYQVKQSNA